MFKQRLGPPYLFINGLLFFISIHPHDITHNSQFNLLDIRTGQNENELGT